MSVAKFRNLTLVSCIVIVSGFAYSIIVHPAFALPEYADGFIHGYRMGYQVNDTRSNDNQGTLEDYQHGWMDGWFIGCIDQGKDPKVNVEFKAVGGDALCDDVYGESDYGGPYPGWESEFK